MPNSLIAVNLSKYKKTPYFLYKSKKVLHNSFYEYKYSGTSIYFTLFESDFVDMISDNYSWVETAKSKTSLFIVASSTVLTEHEIFNPKNGITKVAISRL